MMAETSLIPLNQVHEELGGKMVDFAGYMMPVRYSSDNEEHNTVRNAVGIFDVSHMGEFLVKGKKALRFIQNVSANDASLLEIGKAQYSYFPNETGGIVDDLLVYRLGEIEYMLVVNASNIEKDWNHLLKYKPKEVEMSNQSDEYCLFAVQGPKALETLQKLTMLNLSEIEYYSFEIGKIGDFDNIIFSATGYTGAGGFELYLPNHSAKEIWQDILQAGKEFGIKPIGLGARDTLRLEMGFCLYGNDLSDITSPIEAGLGWVTKFNKEFVGSENLLLQKNEGVNRKLVALEMIDRGIPRAHYEVYNENGENIGEITSGTMSPLLKKGIALAYLQKPFHKLDTEVYVKVRKKLLKAKVVKAPFVKKGV